MRVLLGANYRANTNAAQDTLKTSSHDDQAKEIALDVALCPNAILDSWSQIYPDLLKVRPKDTRLVHDPLDHLAFHVDRSSNARALHQRIVNGRYTPRPAAIVRSAKRNRLTRPLVYASIEDVLVLTTLCRTIHPFLTADLPPWVSFGGRTTNRPRNTDYEGWFLQFLRHRSRIDQIAQNEDDLMVSTDIANFFPTVNLDLLRSKISSSVHLHPYCVNLLFRLLREFGSSDVYDPYALHGLPQEPDDNSRLLASFFLRDLDDALYSLGFPRRYSRFVDDIVMSATSQLEASRLIAKLQQVLEKLGLSVNSSKTQVRTKGDFRQDLFSDENDYLNLFDGPLFMPLYRTTFDIRARKFAAIRPLGSWIQIMRRYYSVARLLESRVLLPHVWTHIRLYPELAPSILDYLQVVQPTGTMVRKLLDLLRTEGAVFEDMQILAYETLLHTPFRNNRHLREQLSIAAWDHLHAKNGYEPPSGYLSSLCILLIYKFGDSSDLEALANLAGKDDLPVECARQLYVILRSEATYRHVSECLPPRYDDPDLWRLVSLFKMIETDPKRVLRAGSRWLKPKGTIQPTRHMFRIRSLPVLTALYWSGGARTESEALIKQFIRTLKSAPNARHVDHVAMARLRDIRT